jgi:voltage-gated potassium channel
VNWLYETIYESDTKAGKLFDVLLIGLISASVIVVMLDSIATVNQDFKHLLYVLEWIFTILFTIEYFLRIIALRKPLGYIFSFYGLIDLLAILPTYLSLFFPATRYFTVIRILRVLRIFRILKLLQYINAANQLTMAMRASRTKITVFLFSVVSLAVVLGSFMYVIEGSENGFTSIPRSIYWAIVTMTTVGYGDISPQTVIGQVLASIIMILGYAIIAIPTGIVTSELNFMRSNPNVGQACPNCGCEGHSADAHFCRKCGTTL